MAIKKFAEAAVSSVVPIETIRSMVADKSVLDRFQQTVNLLKEAQGKTGKKLAPKVDDFTYGVAVMMHACEAALVNQSTGEPLLNVKGEPVRGWFEETTDSRGRPSYKWVSPDGVKPYINHNKDAFPEFALKKAYKDWVGKPLCKDHISSSVDGIRGIIVDTYYDPNFKRVYALFALDKKNYPDLARKVEAGYATCVSMGTAVGRAICTECSNVATVEAEYCHHIKTKSNYAEINVDLAPIELSLVVTGADPQAKIKEVLASLKDYTDKKDANLQSAAERNQVNKIRGDIRKIENQLLTSKADVDLNKLADILEALELRRPGDKNVDHYISQLPQTPEQLAEVNDVGLLNRLLSQAKKYDLEFYQNISDAIANLDQSGDLLIKNPENASIQNPAAEKTVGLTDSEGYTLNDEFPDERLSGDLLPTDIKPPPDLPMQAFTSLYSELSKKGGFNKIVGLESKLADLKEQIKKLEHMNKKEKPMNFAELKERSLRRREAYWQGTEQPKPGQRQYDLMGDQDKIRNTQDKQMVGDELDYGSEKDVLPSGDKAVKEHMQRASLEDRRMRRAAILADIRKAATGGEAVFDAKGNPVGIKTPDGKIKPVSQAAKDSEDASKTKKQAYWQGTEEPKPGQRQYGLMGDQDKIRNTQDKQMVGNVEMGDDGMWPDDEGTKKYWQRMAQLNGKLRKGASADEAQWDIFADGKKVLSVKGSDVYGRVWNTKVGHGSAATFGEYFQNAEYGRRLLSLVREAEGPEGAAKALELPAAPEAAPKGDEMGSAHDKVMSAISAAKDALADAEQALGESDLKDIDVPAEVPAEVGAAPMAPPAMANVSIDDLKIVRAEVDAALDELTYLETELENGNAKVASVIGEAIEDTNTVIAHYRDLLGVFAAKKKKKKEEDAKKMKKEKADKMKAEKEKKEKKEKDMKKKKSDSELLNDLLKVRAERRAVLAAQAMEHLDMDGMGDLGDDADLGDDSAPLSDEELEEMLAAYRSEEPMAYDMMVDDTMCAKDKKSDEDKDDKEEKADKEDKKDEEKADKKDDKEKDARDGGSMGPEFNAPAAEGSVDEGKNASDGQAAKDKKSDKKEDKDDKKEKEEKEDKKDKEDKDDEKDAKDGKSEDGVSAKEKAYVKEEIGEHDKDPEAHKKARKEWRESLVAKAKGGKYMGLYEDVRKDSGTEVSFDAKVSGDNALVENLHVQQEKDLDVARSEPRNVRMAAEKLQNLVAQGSLTEDQIDELVSIGAVDPAAAKYWKDYFRQAPDGGSEFGAEMSKEFEKHKKKAAVAEEKEVHAAKLKRAFRLGLEAQEKGIISKSAAELDKYVDDLVKLPDEAFEAVKRIVAQHKKATMVSAPHVGVNYDDDAEVRFTRTASVAHSGVPDWQELARMFD